MGQAGAKVCRQGGGAKVCRQGGEEAGKEIPSLWRLKAHPGLHPPQHVAHSFQVVRDIITIMNVTLL